MIRWILFLLIFGAIDFYAFQALKTVTKNYWIYGAYWLLSILVIGNFLYHFYGMSRNDFSNSHGYAVAFFLTILVPKLILLIFMFGEDVVRWFVYGFSNDTRSIADATTLNGRRKFLSQIALGIAAIPFASFLYGIYRGKYNYKVLKYALYFEDLPEAFDGYTLTQISDIHSGSFDNADKVKYGVNLINEQKSDVILFTGDIVNSKAEEMHDWLDVFDKLEAKDGKFSILGNHDYGYYAYGRDKALNKSNHEKMEQVHRDIGFDLLQNENRSIEKNGQRINILGVENWGASRHFPKKGSLKKASQGLLDSDFNILLSHDPSHFDYKEMELNDRDKDRSDYITDETNIINFEKKMQLTLAGHTHGMQFGIEIPFLNFKWSPVKYRYPKWAGLYEEAGKMLHVNRGFGYLAFPGRIGIWPEITVIELKKGVKPT